VEHTVTFTNTSQYAEEYYWDFDDGNTSAEFEPVHVYTEAGLYQARLKVTGEGGEDIAYREIEVYPLPVVDFTVAPDTVMLPDQPARMFNFSEDGERYLWDLGDGQTSMEAELSHLYTELGVYDVSLTVWTPYNCMASLTIPEAVVVIGEGKVLFPTAFAPNRNGPTGGYYSLPDISNEIFHPYYEGVTEYNLLIYSRWGERLFESNDVNIGWDGYYEGKLCQQGVYFWVVKGKFTNGMGFEETGDVTLLLKSKDKR
jgi:PKD repeat protein